MFYEKLIFSILNTDKLPVTNQKSLKLPVIGTRVLGRFWSHGTSILEIMSQKLIISVPKIYRKPKNSLQHSNVHNF